MVSRAEHMTNHAISLPNFFSFGKIILLEVVLKFSMASTFLRMTELEYTNVQAFRKMLKINLNKEAFMSLPSNCT